MLAATQSIQAPFKPDIFSGHQIGMQLTQVTVVKSGYDFAPPATDRGAQQAQIEADMAWIDGISDERMYKVYWSGLNSGGGQNLSTGARLEQGFWKNDLIITCLSQIQLA